MLKTKYDVLGNCASKKRNTGRPIILSEFVKRELGILKGPKELRN